MNARDIKTLIETMFKSGIERTAIIAKVITLGIEAEIADFLVELYCRK